MVASGVVALLLQAQPTLTPDQVKSRLINSAKVKNLANDFRVIPTYVYAYQDKYRALPGDDPSAQNHLGSFAAQAPTTSAGNGIINGEWRTTNPSDESYLFWQHVRMANLVAGTTITSDPTYLPVNVEGGRVGVTSSLNSPNPTILRGSFVVCSDGILGKFARQLDTTMDDGKTTSGNVAVFANGATGTANSAFSEDPTATNAIDDNNRYTVCMAF